MRGLVQGVGFRWFVKQQAGALGLSGWVSNQGDGSVALEAEGEPAALEQLKAAIQQGPPDARVDEIICDEVPRQNGAGFRVI